MAKGTWIREALEIDSAWLHSVLGPMGVTTMLTEVSWKYQVRDTNGEVRGRAGLEADCIRFLLPL